MEKIAIDAGHGYMKGLNANGGRALFPSLIAPAPAVTDLGTFGQLAITMIDGTPYVVGEAARPYALPRWSRDKAADDDTLRLILVAAAALGGVGPIQLATGLPLTWFGPQRKDFKEALQGYGGTVVTPQGIHTQLWFESVKVLPQGVAAASAIIADPSRVAGDYVVVDVGYRTIDFLVVTKTPQGTIQFDPTKAGSPELGMHAVTVALVNALTHDYHIPFQTAEIEEAQTIHVRGQVVDLAPRRQQATAHVSQQIREALIEQLDHKMDKIAGLVLVGGGATTIPTLFPHAMVMEDAQWANVTAYLNSLPKPTVSV